ncbi:MAG: glycosyltransferase family 2 protein [Elusimicrobiota bacterium]|jgi:glycosyltransferase involved in cell wall biosynthesis
MKTACVIPAYNEEAALPAVVAGCRRAGLSVCVVDDGSTDATAARARAAGAEVLRHERNLGKGRAIESGAERAASEGCEAVVFLDADGQHDPAELPLFLAALRDGADLVVGCRSFDERMPFVRRMTNRFQSWLLSRIAGRPLGDTQCGYRLVRLALWPRIRPRSGGFAAESEALVRAARAGARLAFVPVRTVYLEGRRSRIRPLRDTGRFILLVLRLLKEGR